MKKEENSIPRFEPRPTDLDVSISPDSQRAEEVISRVDSSYYSCSELYIAVADHI